jgi:hypothetical protein
VIQTILVQPGTTLFQVAAAYFGDATQWSRIASVNNIQDPFFFDAPTTLNLPTIRSDQG